MFREIVTKAVIGKGKLSNNGFLDKETIYKLKERNK